MKLFLCFVIFYTVYAEPEFGRSYLRNTKLCQQWSCLNKKLGLLDQLPPREQFAPILKSLLPEGSWQEAVEPVLNACYVETNRRYSYTCPGQGLMHCVFENLIQNCPESNLSKDDACAPLATLAGMKFMFSQSRYEDLEKHLPTERRPSWFLTHVFSSKCCNLPELFSQAFLSECGFENMIHYYTHSPRNGEPRLPMFHKPEDIKSNVQPRETVKIVDINQNQSQTVTERDFNQIDDENFFRGLSYHLVHFVHLVPHTSDSKNDFNQIDDENFDPLDCCDLSPLIQPSWRSECNFHVSWNDIHRLEINDQVVMSTVPPTTTESNKNHDVKVVPLSCDKQSCVFRKLNIVSDDGVVNLDFFSKLLDNMTNVHPEWTKAKARVVTLCLSKPLTHYTEECEINKILTCTFDVLSENCPHAKKIDPCKRSKVLRDGLTCQISASKYRPKNRRQFCGLPNLVNHEILSECSISSLSHMEYIPESVVSRKPVQHLWASRKFACKELTDQTKCLLNKMGVLNKYNFMDYFKMKASIQGVTSEAPWAPLSEVYTNAFGTMPLYGEHCSSPKKLLNVLDPMLMTCPISKRKETPQCNRLFTKIQIAAPLKTNGILYIKPDQLWKHFQHVYLPQKNIPTQLNQIKHTGMIEPVKRVTKKYNSFINSDSIPPVRIMKIKPQPLSRPKPLVILPVYLRNKGKGSLSVQLYRDGLFRSEPFGLHNSIAATHGGEKKLV